MRKIVPLLAPLALGLPAIPAARAEVPTPSFACSAARTEVERTVCTTPELAREDAVMARLYAAARRGARDDGQSGQGAAQLAWLRERAGCEKFNSSAYTSRAECLGGQYRTRNIALATAALFTDREFALEQLRRLDPKDAPLVTALVIHASHPPGRNFRATSRCVSISSARCTTPSPPRPSSRIIRNPGMAGTASNSSVPTKSSIEVEDSIGPAERRSVSAQFWRMD